MMCHPHNSTSYLCFAPSDHTHRRLKGYPNEVGTLHSCVVKCFSRITGEDYDYSSID